MLVIKVRWFPVKVYCFTNHAKSCIWIKQYLVSATSPEMHIYKMGYMLNFDKPPKVLHESKHKPTVLASGLVIVLFSLLG